MEPELVSDFLIPFYTVSYFFILYEDICGGFHPHWYGSRQGISTNFLPLTKMILFEILT